MHVSTAKRTVAALAVATASVGMVFAAVAPASATAGTTVTSYNQACRAVSVGQTVDQVVPTSVTANHVTVNATPGVNSYTLQPGSATTPSSSGVSGVTFLGIDDVRLVYRYDPATFVAGSAALVAGSGSGYTGTVTLTDTGSQLIVDGADVGVGVTYQLPKISFQTRNSALDVKFDTQGTAAQMYNFSANYFRFTSKASVPIFGTVSAPTSCIPANAVGATGSYPALNSGAGVLHP